MRGFGDNCVPNMCEICGLPMGVDFKDGLRILGLIDKRNQSFFDSINTDWMTKHHCVVRTQDNKTEKVSLGGVCREGSFYVKSMTAATRQFLDDMDRFNPDEDELYTEGNEFVLSHCHDWCADNKGNKDDDIVKWFATKKNVHIMYEESCLTTQVLCGLLGIDIDDKDFTLEVGIQRRYLYKIKVYATMKYRAKLPNLKYILHKPL